MDYVEQNIDDMIYSYDTPAISKLYNEKWTKWKSSIATSGTR